MQQQEKIFADGFSFKRREGAPSFVIGRQSIKQSKGGNYYCELDTWEAKPQGNVQKEIAMPLPQDEGADLPF